MSGFKRGTHVLRQLLQVHEDRIKRFIGRRSGPQVLARTTIEDLYQETALSALAAAEHFVFVDEPRFFGWVYKVASSVISQTVNRGNVRDGEIRIRGSASTGVGVTESAIPGMEKSPSSAASAGEQSGSLRRAIHALSPRYREVLTLYKIEERSLADVAEHFGLTKNATARLIGRALESLKLSLTK